ncbi:MAG: class I SAM-dependent methyltransferase [Thermomicrobiales bacterium]
MSSDRPAPSASWQESDSATFIDVGRVMIPRRDEIERTIVALVPGKPDAELTVVDIAAGVGWLSKAILARYPRAHALLLDGSDTMLAEAERNLAEYAGRYELRQFRLEDEGWIDALPAPVRCVVSSLAIHHRDAAGKRALYRRLLPALKPGGGVLIADLFQPASPAALRLAAREWDDEVRSRSLELTGTLDAWELFDGDDWNIFDHPDPIDTPSPIADQLDWFREAGYVAADVFWAYAGHAVYGAFRPE